MLRPGYRQLNYTVKTTLNDVAVDARSASELHNSPAPQVRHQRYYQPRLRLGRTGCSGLRTRERASPYSLRCLMGPKPTRCGFRWYEPQLTTVRAASRDDLNRFRRMESKVRTAERAVHQSEMAGEELHNERAAYCLQLERVADQHRRIFEEAGDHAGELETSMAGHFASPVASDQADLGRWRGRDLRKTFRIHRITLLALADHHSVVTLDQPRPRKAAPSQISLSRGSRVS